MYMQPTACMKNMTLLRSDLIMRLKVSMYANKIPFLEMIDMQGLAYNLHDQVGHQLVHFSSLIKTSVSQIPGI